MAEIPVERKEKSGLPWWLIPLALLLLLPLLFFGFCNRGNGVVVDNRNNNGNRTSVATTTGSTGNSTTTAANGSNVAVVTNSNTSGSANDANKTAAIAFDEEARIREANERARVAMEKYYPNGTPQQVIEALNLSAINFAKGSNDIPEANKALLKQAAEQLKKSPADTRVEIDGHTDNDGDDATNLKLSERRAASVRNQLISYGVPAAMLSIKGYGETQPKASNDTPEGRFENRRIEYKVATSNTTAEKVAPNGNAGK